MATKEARKKLDAATIAAMMGVAAEPLEYASILLEGMPSLPLDCAEALLEGALRRISAAEVADWVNALPQCATAAYLQAKLSDAESSERAVGQWKKFLDLSGSRERSVLLRYAQLLCENREYTQALPWLRESLHGTPSYSFFAKSAVTAERIMQNTSAPRRKLRIALLGSSTTAFLAQVLRTICFREGIYAEIYEGLYGNMQQEIIDPQSGLYRFRPEVVFLIPVWRDLPFSGCKNDPAIVQQVTSEYTSLWSRLRENCPCSIVQHSFELPDEDAAGYFSDSLPGGIRSMISRVNQLLRERAPSGVSILDVEQVAKRVGSASWNDNALWFRARQYPALEALPTLALKQCAYIRAVCGLARKLVVCDLDNTLWGGVIGEDGLEGIEIGPGTERGEAYAELQRYLLDLKRRGILLAVCSKNNPDDARLPFLQHPQMLLRLQDFVAFEANWNDKASNLRAIAQSLSLGTESFVFLDDSPLEREWVHSQMPDVAVLDLPARPHDFVKELDREDYFFALALTEEDRKRTETYHAESARGQLQKSAESLEEFLRELSLRGRCVSISPGNLSRVTQLVNKTNQFNLTTRRYTEAQVSELAARPRSWLRAFHVADRFGDYGLIGALFCLQGGEDQWQIDSWLMSCRALGRGVERYMFNQMLEAAEANGIANIEGSYRPTAKNTLVETLLPDFGFVESSRREGEVRFTLAVASAEPRPIFIADESRSERPFTEVELRSRSATGCAV